MTRKLIDFLKSPTGRLLAFFLVAGIAVLLYQRYKPAPPAADGPTSFNDAEEHRRDFRGLGDFGWGDDWDANAGRRSGDGSGPNGRGRDGGGREGDDWDNLLGKNANGGKNGEGSSIDRGNFKPVGKGGKKGDGSGDGGRDGTSADGSGRNGDTELTDAEREAARRKRELLDKLRKLKLEMALKDAANANGSNGDGSGGNGRNGNGRNGANGAFGSGGLYVSDVVLYESGAEAKRIQAAKGGLSDTYAPYGRLITCQMVNTVDSANMLTPVVALVMEDVWHNGKIVIPAGTEVHGKAVSATTRDRIATETGWVFVWRTKTPDNGKEMAVQALALDYTKNIKTGRYDVTDGSAGLRGFQMQTAEYAKLKLYLAQFTAGAGSGLAELLIRKATTSGSSTYVDSEVQGTEGDDGDDEEKVALAAGAQQVADQMIGDLVDELSRNGSFVRVPAGTTFYLYVMQTIDKKFARPGATIGVGVETPETKEDPLVTQQKEANALMREAIKSRLESRENRKNVKNSIRK